MKIQVPPTPPPPSDEPREVWNLRKITLPARLLHHIKMVNCRMNSDESARALSKNAHFDIWILSSQSIQQRKHHDLVT
jgi:hypothetical protein